ncbi:hypothetical protein Agub_g4083 [Astrephomene gubernaculifera]|uniref:Uncharacterized protein n=1 Tax=Astrephomene gubernaculifera TaxID=47775 RepID=A0AAD3DJN4_9CHLO|nr:hypothetical protein Agub_g4083 [Astrephomene gubernaculifera]
MLHGPLRCPSSIGLSRGRRPPPGAPSRGLRSVMAAERSHRPVILLDIMDTVVYDPFFHDMPAFFGMSFKELLASKHPTAWVEFERGLLTEDELFLKFFSDGRFVDGSGLKAMMASSYRYLDGMPQLLGRLKAAGFEMHAVSNYPTWYRLIEEKLRPSEYLSWTFVSCEGPMKGYRKPAREAYEACVKTLQRSPEELIFVDDRKVNVEGACAVGLEGILFESASQLEAELRCRGLTF